MDKFECLHRLTRARDLTPAQFRAAVAVLNYADSATCSNAYPGYAKLADDLGIDDRQVRRTIGELVAKGYLVVTDKGGSAKGGKRRAATYSVTCPHPDPGSSTPGVEDPDPGCTAPPVPRVHSTPSTPGVDDPGSGLTPGAVHPSPRVHSTPSTPGAQHPPTQSLPNQDPARARGVARVRAAARAAAASRSPAAGRSGSNQRRDPTRALDGETIAQAESLRAAAAAALAELRKEAS